MSAACKYSSSYPRHNSHFRQSTHFGFTIIELVIVIAVIGVLATVALIAYNGIQNRARIANLQGDLNGASKTLEIANVTSGVYPADLIAANLKVAVGTTLNYSVSTDLAAYCLTATNSGIRYRVSSNNTTSTAGSCPGVMTNGTNCPYGFIVVPGSSTYGTSEFCIMKYEAKNVGGIATSQASGIPWGGNTQTAAVTSASAACSGCHLTTEAEWLTIAKNVVSVASNWIGGVVGSGTMYNGHNDGIPNKALMAGTDDNDGYSSTGNSAPSEQRRTLTLTNGEVIWDMSGNNWEWTSGTSTTGQPGSSGYGTREWKTISTPGTLSPNPAPAYGTPAASAWGRAEHMGDIYSNSDETTLRGILRGNAWNPGPTTVGVYSMAFNLPNSTYAASSFRVSK